MKGSVVSLACALFALAACSTEEEPFVLGGPNDLPDGSFGTPGRDSGLDAGNEKGPVVSVTSPLSVLDPSSGSVLTGSSAEVRCEVKQRAGGSPIDPNKITVSAFAPGASMPAARVNATLKGTDTFGAIVPLSDLPTGRIRLECSAFDTAGTPQEALARIDTLYDGGPTITFSNLNENSIVQRGKDSAVDVAIQFKAEAAPLAPGDTGADIADLKLLINDMEIPLGAPVNGEYKKEIDFYELFKQAPITSFTIKVRATNRRTPAATAQKQLIVRVDGDGPEIKVTSPSEFAMVGGTVTVRMEISDPLAGITEAQDKLYVVMMNNGVRVESYLVTQDAPGSKDYRFTFEASRFPNMRDIVAQIHASDKTGNESQKEHPMRLDTVPPFVSLDPPNFARIESSRCDAFDPLGASPNDGEIVAQLSRFRALVVERGIRLPGATEYYFAGVREDSVVLYAQENPAEPLLIDTDNNGVCDAINNAQSLGANAPFAAPLRPVAPGGTLRGTVDSATGACVIPASEVTTRCPGSEMHNVPGHTAITANSQPISVIYGYGPTMGTSLGCTGTSLDMGGDSGWACVAVAARDLTNGGGYLGVSKPIRVCRWLKAGDCGQQFPPDPSNRKFATPPAELTCTRNCRLPEAWINPGADERF